MNSRKDILLRAAFDILKRCSYAAYDTLAFYDESDCDGNCLANDIADELGIDHNEPPLTLREESTN